MPGPISSSKKTPLSAEVVRFRRFLKMTQKAFAEELGVNSLTISRWETSLPPRDASLEKIAELAEKRKYPRSTVFRAPLEAGTAAMSETIKGSPADSMIRMKEAQLSLIWLVDWAAGLRGESPKNAEARKKLVEVLDAVTVQVWDTFAMAVNLGARTKEEEKK